MRTRMYGGVGGRKTKVGRKLTFVFLLPDSMHFLHHRHKTGRAVPGLNCVAGFESPACVYAGLGACTLTYQMRAAQNLSDFFAQLDTERTAAGEILQASCSKSLRKLNPRACSTFFCLTPKNFICFCFTS